MPTSTPSPGYRGMPCRDEILRAASQTISGESLRAVVNHYRKHSYDEVKQANGTRAVTFNMKVAENIFSGRLVHTAPSALRRTERWCRQMLECPDLSNNTRAVLEFLRERCLMEEGYQVLS